MEKIKTQNPHRQPHYVKSSCCNGKVATIPASFGDPVITICWTCNKACEGCDNLIRTYCSSVNLPSVYGTVNNTFLVVDAYDTGNGVNYGTVPFNIQNNKMIFETNHYDGKKVTVQYLAFKVDCDGYMEVGENHINAIKWFIIWMYYMGKPSMNSLEYGKMNKAEQEWNRECSHARAMDAIPSPSDWRKINGMLHDPYGGISLNSGMYTTLGGMYNIW